MSKMILKEFFLMSTALLLLLVDKSLGINCYQCRGTDPSTPFQCNEWLDSDIDIEPEPCDNVYGAQYCVKHLGRFEASSIKCYQCSSSETIDCSDGMIHMAGGLEPKSCGHIFEAQYCIKSTSLDGGIGAKRFCSSLDLGNYCNYVKQPGDMLTYRTCVFTCTGDGCNPGHMNKATNSILLLSVSIPLVLYKILIIR